MTGDVRLYLAAGYALLMQVSHPTVGAGVRDHSTFAEDPWGRLLRTMDYLYLITLSGPESADVGRRVRELHKRIKGTNPDGSRYHALEPEAYAWVHATLIEATVRGRRKFVAPDERGSEIDAFYDAWMPLGRLLGVRPGDLPDDWDGFRDYFATMSHDRLERNETVEEVVRDPGRARAAAGPRHEVPVAGAPAGARARDAGRHGRHAAPRAARALRARVDSARRDRDADADARLPRRDAAAAEAPDQGDGPPAPRLAAERRSRRVRWAPRPTPALPDSTPRPGGAGSARLHRHGC